MNFLLMELSDRKRLDFKKRSLLGDSGERGYEGAFIAAPSTLSLSLKALSSFMRRRIWGSFLLFFHFENRSSASYSTASGIETSGLSGSIYS